MHCATLSVYFSMKLTKLFLGGFLISLVTGCLLLTLPIEDAIQIPTMPEYWAGAETFCVTIMNNTAHSERTALPGTVLKILQKPGSYTAITLTAQFQTGSTVPIGTLLPWLAGKEGICFDREGGFCALLAELLWKQGYDIHNFNWKRLYELLKTVQNSIWNINLQELARAIIQKKFRADMVTKKYPSFTVTLPTFCETFYPANPFLPVVHEGEQLTIALSPGKHIWFAKNSMLVVTIDSKGRYTIFY